VGAHLYARPPYGGGKGRARRVGGWVWLTAKRTTTTPRRARLRGYATSLPCYSLKFPDIPIHFSG
ncbi:MAG: hypothetical protein K2O70_10235, partial [Desulfovibrionaceae bacterium]|nr:hypothetical protein [Desulfovibrionaceae bacterium]